MPSTALPPIAIAFIALGIAPFAIYMAFKRPLIFPFGLYIMVVPFDALLGTTATITRLIAIVAAGALILQMLATRRVLAPPKSWTVWAAFILWASLTALWTVDSHETGIVVPQLLQLFAFFTILAIFPAEPKDVRFVGGIIVASGVLLSAIGLVNYLLGTRTEESRLVISANGLTLDPNHIAASLLLPIAIALGTLLETRDIRLRLTSLAASITMIGALFLTGSRGGVIALAVMFLYLAWKTRYRLQLLGLMALAGSGSLLLPTVWNRFADKGLSGGSGRVFIWNAGKLAFKDHWLTGAGFGGFPAAYNHELLSMYQPIFQGWSRPAHNAFLSAAVELGILGAALLIYAWWQSWRDAQGNVVIEASLVGLVAASFFLDVILFKYIWLAFTMALLVNNAANPRFLRGRHRQSQPNNRGIVIARDPAWRPRRRQVAIPNAESLASNP